MKNCDWQPINGCRYTYDEADPAAVSAYALHHVPGHVATRTYPKMPDVEGLDPFNAARLIVAAGVPMADISTVNIGSTKTIGTVDRSNPTSGQDVLGPVTIFVVTHNIASPATPRTKVPYIGGYTSVAAIRRKLGEARLDYDLTGSRTLGYYDPGVNEGVYLVYPAEGTEVDEGTEVRVEMNPPRPATTSTTLVKVPDLIGRTETDARDRCENRDLRLPRSRVSVATTHNPAYAVGVVIRQAPDDGEEVAKGTAVEVELNQPKPTTSFWNGRLGRVIKA